MQLKKSSNLTLTAATLVALLGFATTAQAGLILTVSDGTTTTTVNDTDSDGAVTFSGSLGTWVFNVVVGLSKPLIGDAYTDEMHLTSVNVSGGTGTITVTLEDDGFTKLNANWISEIGGVTAGPVSAQTFIAGTQVATHSATGGAFSDTKSGQVNALAPYSIKLVASVTHSRAGQSSSIDYVVKVPEPGTLTLMGAGLLGLAFLRRRRPV